MGVPVVARLPGVIPAGSHSGEICNLMDIGPTLTEVAGATSLPRTDGHSLWQILQGHSDPRRPGETFSEHGPTRGEACSRMIRRGQWKLYKYADDTPPVMFDLAADPQEEHDLAGDTALAPLRQQLLRDLFSGWDPDAVQRECERQLADMSLLSAWGAAVKPTHEDSLAVPEDAEQIERR